MIELSSPTPLISKETLNSVCVMISDDHWQQVLDQMKGNTECEMPFRYKDKALAEGMFLEPSNYADAYSIMSGEMKSKHLINIPL